MKLNQRTFAVIVAIHVAALAAFVPWCFSWSGLILMLVGMYVCGGLGITIGFHRLLSHRSFQCALWFEKFLVYCGILSLMDTPLGFVTTHRQHHQHSDDDQDPHSPTHSLLWSHVGWTFADSKFTTDPYRRIATMAHFAKDLLQNRWYIQWENYANYISVYLVHAVLIGMMGFLLGGLQLAASWIVWVVFLRTVLVWNITWSVNSLSHRFGYRNYETPDNSRNLWWVALLSQGEWHNNHHECPSSAKMGHRRFEFDAGYWTLQLLKKVGIVTHIKTWV